MSYSSYIARREEEIDIEGTVVGATLSIQPEAHGIVVFAHGSGSSRFSKRNRYVASVLEQANFATLLLDLLTPGEAQNRANVFDITLLAYRLEGAARWLRARPDMATLPLAFFGASTGAAAALVAAADDPTVRAVVSRGGRPDLAGHALQRVVVPTLLIVGGNDPPVLELNRDALRRLRGPKQLTVIPGATHLFEEPGALEKVAVLASDWFAQHLAPPTLAGAESPHRTTHGVSGWW